MYNNNVGDTYKPYSWFHEQEKQMCSFRLQILQMFPRIINTTFFVALANPTDIPTRHKNNDFDLVYVFAQRNNHDLRGITVPTVVPTQ